MTLSNPASPRLQGVVVPLATPLNEDESIDLAGLRKLLRHVLDGGVDGIFLLGSTSEFPALADSEKARLIEATVSEVSGAVPLFVGSGSVSTLDAIRQARRAAELGADAIVVTTPYYYTYGPDPQAMLLEHFTQMAAAVDLPLVAYNIPQLTGLPLNLATVERLVEAGRITGIKDSHGDMVYFQRLLEIQRSRQPLSVAQGADALIAVSVLAGARAVVVSGANVAPRLTKSLFEASVTGRVDEAMRLQYQLMEVIALYQGRGSPVGVKSCLEALGICSRRATRPFLPMTDAEMARVRDKLAALGLMPAPARPM